MIVRKETDKQIRSNEPAIPIPYPQRLNKSKLERQFTKFLDILKKLHINIPFFGGTGEHAKLREILEKDLGK